MTVVARVPSLTTPGKSYAVRRFPAGLTCDCPAFEAHAVDESTDKHIAIYRAAAHALKRCSDADHRAAVVDVGDDLAVSDVALCRQCLVDLLAASATKVRRRYVAKEQVEAIKQQAAAKMRDIRSRKRRTINR